MKYVFYDLETTGRSPQWDQIIQLAAIITDTHLNIVDKINISCRLKSSCVPDPEALLVNKIPIRNLYRSNFSLYQLLLTFKERIDHWKPLIFIGYNSINYDEEMLRNGFFTNLLEPYYTIKDSNTRSDLLNSVRISNFFYPNIVKSTISENGKAIMKLDQLAPVNNITAFKAHDAMGDTYATLELAKIIHSNLPDIWINSTEKMHKKEIEKNISKAPFCYIESFFGNIKCMVLSYVCLHPKYKWALCFDLKNNPKDLLDLDTDEQIKFLDSSPKVIRNVKLNKSPILLPLKYKDKLDDYKLLSNETILDRHNFINNNTSFKDLIIKYYNQKTTQDDNSTSQLDILAEESIYKKFISSHDNKLMEEFHRSEWKDRKHIKKQFRDERLNYFADLLFYHEIPNELEKSTYNKISRSISERLLSKNKEKWLTIYDAYKKIDDLREKYDNNNDIEALTILNELNEYVENMEKKLS